MEWYEGKCRKGGETGEDGKVRGEGGTEGENERNGKVSVSIKGKVEW